MYSANKNPGIDNRERRKNYAANPALILTEQIVHYFHCK